MSLRQVVFYYAEKNSRTVKDMVIFLKKIIR